MEESKKTCTSCKKRITNDTGVVKFQCPNCGKYEIVRCQSCRKNASKYKCTGCDFVGPN